MSTPTAHDGTTLPRVDPLAMRVGDSITTARSLGLSGRTGKVVEIDSDCRARVLWWGSRTRWSSPSTLRKYYALPRSTMLRTKPDADPS